MVMCFKYLNEQSPKEFLIIKTYNLDYPKNLFFRLLYEQQRKQQTIDEY